ncbi:MAG: fumarylacetoacetate hydrolase family protein [SAR324 cluster bacterium]|nr:fumarylacetoacetate hydrolase family protein [SAR324 cluster bacterium]
MNLQAAIDSIWECKQQGIYYPREWRGKFGVDDGYRVQLGILAKQIKSGERHAGWKVGLTGKAIQAQVNFHEQVFGYLLESGELKSGAVIAFDDLVAPSFETELCVTIGQPLKGPNATAKTARAAICGVAPSIELVEKRGDFAGDPPLSMADNVQQKYFITGPLTSPLAPDVELRETAVEIFIDGECLQRAAGHEVMGGPEASVAWLANKLSEFGRKLEPGMRVMTGSLTKQFTIAPGDLIEARFDPYGSVTAEFK